MRTSGLISSTSSANPNSTLPASSETTPDNYTSGRKESGIQSAEDVAGAVWKFLGAAGSLVDELDKEDDVRLLRLRTKKNELVIVPGKLPQGAYSALLNNDRPQIHSGPHTRYSARLASSNVRTYNHSIDHLSVMIPIHSETTVENSPVCFADFDFVDIHTVLEPPIYERVSTWSPYV